MKTIYKLMIFFAIFQMTPLVLNSLTIFPYTFYSDAEVGVKTGDPYILNDDSYYLQAENIFAQLFLPADNPYFSSAHLTVIFAVFLGVGAASAILTKSYVVIPLMFQGYMVLVMLSRSLGFFGKMLYSWDSRAVGYLALIIGVCIVMLIVITWMETATHGDV